MYNCYFCLTVILNLAQLTLPQLSVSLMSAVFCSTVFSLNTVAYPYHLILDQTETLGPFCSLCVMYFLDSILCSWTRQLPLKTKTSCSTNIFRSSFYHSELILVSFSAWQPTLLVSSAFFWCCLCFLDLCL